MPQHLLEGRQYSKDPVLASCHTMEIGAELDASFIFDCQWSHGSSDQDIFDTVTNGVTGTRMVGFGSNFPEGDDDLWKVIAYLRSNQQAC